MWSAYRRAIQHSFRIGQAGCDNHLFWRCTAQSSNFGIYITSIILRPSQWLPVTPFAHLNVIGIICSFFFVNTVFWQGHGWYKMRYSCVWVHNVNLTFIKPNPCSDVLGDLNTFSDSYEYPRLHGNQRFINVFLRVRNLSLNCVRLISAPSPYFTP